MDTDSLKKLRIFAASPRDVANERARLAAVVEDLKALNAWFTQLMDALTGLQEEEGAELQHEFAASLRCAMEQARSGEGIDLQTFRYQSGLRRCLS